MNLWQRISIGMSFIVGRQDPRKHTKQAASLRPSWEYLRPTYALTGNFPNLVEEGFYKNELIYACISKSAASASQISLAVRKKKDRSLVADHPLLDLVHKPNDEMNEYDLWSSMVFFQKLAGRAIYEKERDRRGRVVRLLPLRPDWVKINPGRMTRIGNYFYQPPGTEGVALAPNDVLDIPLFDPLLRFSTKSPLSVLARGADVDNAITDFIKLFFENGGSPQGVFMSEAEMDDEDVMSARKRWRELYGGHRNWIDPAFVSGPGLEYKQLGSSFKDMGFEVLDERNEARICEVLDVPPIIVGARIGLKEATYSNYEQARKAWWEDSLSPMYVNYLDVIGRLMDETDRSGENYVDWDFSHVKAFQEEINKRWDRATNALRSGGITRNQFFAEVGLPGGDPADDVYLMPLNVIAMPSGVLPKSFANTSGSSGNGKTLSITLDRSKANRPIDEQARTAAEAKMQTAMEGYFSKQFGKIKDTLNGA